MTMVAGAVDDLLIVAAMVHDWRSHGRVHPAYWWGFGITLIALLLRPLVAHSSAWLGIADFLAAF